MKLRFALSSILFSILIISANASLAQAQWNTIKSGYAVTTDWHGEYVPLGTVITATAGTTNPLVESVEFRWLRPNGSIAWSVTNDTLLTSPWPPPTVPQEVIDYENSTAIWYTQNTTTPDEAGDWTVQVLFHDEGKIQAKGGDIVRIRATSFFIPEVPFGTIAILLAMFGALGIFAIRRKRSLSTGVHI